MVLSVECRCGPTATSLIRGMGWRSRASVILLRFLLWTRLFNRNTFDLRGLCMTGNEVYYA